MTDQTHVALERRVGLRRIEDKLARLTPEQLATIERLVDALLVATPDETDLICAAIKCLPIDLDTLNAVADIVLRRHEGPASA